VFTLEMLPASQGDSLWIEYGAQADVHRVLIDGGTAPTYDHIRARVLRVPEGQRRFDLLVVTHVDADHIEGIVLLLQDPTLHLQFDDIWFNGWKHLPSSRLGPAQGEMLSGLLVGQAPEGAQPAYPDGLPWNNLFGAAAVEVPVDPAIDLPQKTLGGGMKVTVLSPTRDELRILAPYWEREVKKAHLDPGDAHGAMQLLGARPALRWDALGGASIDVDKLAETTFDAETAEANGSSIILLAEFDGKSCLLAGDGHAQVLAKTIPRLVRMRGNADVDTFKLPHHGSMNNVSLDLVKAVPAAQYLFSSNGAKYEHPDEEAVSRVLVGSDHDKELVFNYRTVHNEMWADGGLLSPYNATSRFPGETGSGMGVSVPV
jgi:beta-lactamase superfamily II metal-dependent hydrolase